VPRSRESREVGRRPYRHDLLVRSAASTVLPHRLRPLILRRAGLEFDENCFILGGLVVLNTEKITFGRDCFINHGCLIDASAAVSVGHDVHLAAGVQLLTATHDVGTGDRRAGTPRAAPIRIGDGVWLGARVTVLAGVAIGDGAVVAAGAIVTNDLLKDRLYGGVPARLLRRLET